MKFIPGAPAHVIEHFEFFQNAVKGSFEMLLSNRTSQHQMFIISGLNPVIDEPEEGDVTVTIDQGVVCFNGEPLFVPAQEITHDPSEVAYIILDEVAVDATPVTAMGQSVNAMFHRFGKLVKGSNFPAADQHIKLDALTMDDINRSLMGARSLQELDIIPTAMTTTELQAWYDSTGLGIAQTPGEGRALCNGLNGTPDMRGLVAVGAVNGVQAGVQPLPGPVAKQWDINEVDGEESHELTIDEMPEHSHVHNMVNTTPQSVGGNNLDGGTLNRTTFPHNTTDTGGSQAHNNIQPSRALVYVMILPS